MILLAEDAVLPGGEYVASLASSLVSRLPRAPRGLDLLNAAPHAAPARLHLKSGAGLWGDVHSEAAARFVLLRALPGSAIAPKARRKRSAPHWRVGGAGSAVRTVRAAVLPS
jgi:hypothetical protein